MPADDDAEEVRAAASRLYGVTLEQFLSVRAELVAEAKRQGRSIAARQIGAMRKPTQAASVVNRWALHEPDSVDRLADLYDRLSRAHNDLDAAALRELSTERREFVGEATRTAFEQAGIDDPSTTLRDDVTSTLDAAVADPETLAELGRLTKSRRWSGFGVAPPNADAPELTLVRGGKAPSRARRGTGSVTRSTSGPVDGSESGRSGPAITDDSVPTHSDPGADTEHKAVDQRRRRLARARAKAAAAFEKADADLAAAQHAERTTSEKARSLSSNLADLQRELDQTARELDKARREVKTLKGRRREARSAVDRLERQLSD